jgi:hypothetical protein
MSVKLTRLQRLQMRPPGWMIPRSLLIALLDWHDAYNGVEFSDVTEDECADLLSAEVKHLRAVYPKLEDEALS